MTTPMDAEFDTVAEWTAEVAAELGHDHALAAACRGSGGPDTLAWFLDRLRPTARHRMLDCGGGMGGPAAYAWQTVGVRPVLTDPEPGACRSARRLFGLPAVQAGTALPFRSGSFAVAWCLGVLCTVDDQPALVRELHRVLRPGGRLGLLVYVAVDDVASDQPAGNHFPTATRVAALLEQAGLQVVDRQAPIDTRPPSTWEERSADVATEVARRHRHDPRWRLAEDQQERIGGLLQSGRVEPAGLIVQAATRAGRGAG